MNEQELLVILKDTQEALVQVGKRLKKMEEDKPESKDYSAELADIGKKLDNKITEETLVGMKASILKHAKATDSLVTALEEQRKAISEMPNRIKVNVEHRITGRQRPYIITGAIVVVVSVFSLFVSFQLWRSNSELQDSDIKTRMVRLFYPDVSLDVDSIYNSNPKELKLWVKQEEERLLAIRKAEENAKQSTEQAERANEMIKRLKKQGDNDLK
ncbi:MULTISPECIES: hypothetical protein [Sphingobacterium]|uniref:hypothetical protein n=1 Tax=Sphingobacterium TaxID=28453 RepID=UPI000E05D4A1|nr:MULTISPECIES: hypothetical protein [Sphingobacterium]QQT47173.1 hypothetical protein I6J00_11155 [Sphingobacterium multivorum]SUJ13389.1 Uncharacterised protein [Sphingobacterium multivorum]HBW80739.1 hypothetical protein [Sphingobacterium sp.]